MSDSPDNEPIPLARPELGEREEELALEVLRSGRLSLGPMGERFERAFAELARGRGRGRRLQRHRGAAPRRRALGWGEGDEVLTSPFSFVASANCLLYEGARPVFCDVDPETLDLDPAAAAAALGERTAGILPVHIFGYPAAMAELEALAAANGLGILEDACEALGAVDARRAAGRRARQPRHLRLLRQQADDDGRGGDGRPLLARGRGSPALASATRAAPRTWAGSTTAGSASTTGSATSPPRSASPRSRSSTACSSAARRSPPPTPSASPRSTASRPRSPAAAPSGAAGSSTRSGSPPRPTATRRSPRLAERGIASKAYLPCIHLFPHLRELGYREGQFPVAEEASARSLALPFFTSMTDAQVDRVCEALAQSLT